MNKKIIAAVLSAASILAVPTCLAATEDVVPEGVSVEAYDAYTDYLTMMKWCVDEGTPYSLRLGAIYETQRNMKIDDMGLEYEKTAYFTDLDADATRERFYGPAIEEEEIIYYTSSDVMMLAKVAYLESRGIKSKTEIACVMWTILNRYDAGYASSIAGVITAPNQFAYYSNARVVNDYGYDLTILARDVLSRWNSEKNGKTDVGRVLPKGYLWYAGDGRHNYFRNAYSGGQRWNYSLPSPYEN